VYSVVVACLYSYFWLFKISSNGYSEDNKKVTFLIDARIHKLNISYGIGRKNMMYDILILQEVICKCT